VIGSSSMPYLNGLAKSMSWRRSTKPTPIRRLAIISDSRPGRIITNDDSFNKTATADNVVRHLLAAGKTRKAIPGAPAQSGLHRAREWQVGAASVPALLLLRRRKQFDAEVESGALHPVQG